nr:MAG TPA: hypothetical protein [Caudoviricetes sp.]
MSGGTGGISSDEVTATKSQVLQGYTALTNDSDDEPIEGTMINRGNGMDTVEFVDAYWDSKYLARMEQGYYAQNGQWKPYVGIPYAVLANGIHLDANKMLDTLQVSGVRGTIPVRGYHGPDSTEMWYFPQESGYVIRIEEGYYHKGGQVKPYILASPSLVKNAVNYHPEKTLSDTRTCEEQGQIKMVNTQDNNYAVNQAKLFGMDPGRGKLVMQLGHGNAYYYRNDNSPHVEVDASVLGTAGADSVLQWQTATSQHGIKFEGAIPRWICNTGDVISAVNNSGFAWDDATGANRGRGIVSKIPNGHYIQGAQYVFLPSPNLYPWNIREGVNIHGIIGTMKDTNAGRVVFNGATFDGTIASGVANKGFYVNNVYYVYSLNQNYGYAGIGNGGMNFNQVIDYDTRSRRIGCMLSHSIDLTPFRQIIVDYRTLARIQGEPYTTLEILVNRVSTRRFNYTAGVGNVDSLDGLKLGNASYSLNRVGQIVLDVSDINEQAFIGFGAYCDRRRNSDVISGAVQITRIEFKN